LRPSSQLPKKVRERRAKDPVCRARPFNRAPGRDTNLTRQIDHANSLDGLGTVLQLEHERISLPASNKNRLPLGQRPLLAHLAQGSPISAAARVGVNLGTSEREPAARINAAPAACVTDPGQEGTPSGFPRARIRLNLASPFRWKRIKTDSLPQEAPMYGVAPYRGTVRWVFPTSPPSNNVICFSDRQFSKFQDRLGRLIGFDALADNLRTKGFAPKDLKPRGMTRPKRHSPL
jgi:hypothetical protein